MKIALLITLLLAGVSTIEKDKLTGRWESRPSPKGSVTGVIFKEDKSFEGYVNKKPFTSGVYAWENDLFTFTDNGCDGKKGVYKIAFFSNDDSLRFVPVEDSCIQRKEGMSKLVMGRVK
jgi:hypothetical protein